jgi:hypothetical protein
VVAGDPGAALEVALEGVAGMAGVAGVAGSDGVAAAAGEVTSSFPGLAGSSSSSSASYMSSFLGCALGIHVQKKRYYFENSTCLFLPHRIPAS